MEPFEIHILGCGSALPTTRHNASAQVVKIGNRQFLVDCGEGTQLQLRKSSLSFSQINHIFISHLHGDHCFGLVGLISTFSLLGRTLPLHIYAHPMLKKIMQPQIDYFCSGMKYEIVFHDIDPAVRTTIYEDKTITVETLTLDHRQPCCGFLFSEKPKKRHLRGDMVEFYNIPIYMRGQIKDGEDFVTSEGETIPNSRLTRDAEPSRRYAYCSDTRPIASTIEAVRGFDALYHEATFATPDAARAHETTHSTAAQAAEIARAAEVKKLIIGHFSSRYDNDEILLHEAQEIFPDTLLAKENRIFSI